MTIANWSLLIGILLITMVLSGTLLTRLPLSSAMIYLGLGSVLGPGGIGVITVDPFHHAESLALMSEVAVLISLFAVGLKLGVPMLDRRWLSPVRLAFPTMVITVGLIAGIGILGLGLSPGAGVLLGAILAPTDPVLASGIQSESGASPDRVRFSLAGEGALTDGSAFPFVLLGLGMLDLHPLGDGDWFGIRGIGSVFYLMYALPHGVVGPLAQDLVSLTLVTVSASILAHGISALPPMTWYASRMARK